MEIKSTRKRGYRPKLSKRTKDQREFDMAFCSNLFLRGYTYDEIAKALNAENLRRGTGYTLTRQMVYYDMQALLIEWKRERMDNIDDYVTQELRKLDKIEAETWAAWEKSKEVKTKTKTKKAGKGAMGRQYLIEEATETTSGNPRFLDLLLNVQQRRAKLLGFDAPIKIDIPGVNRSMDDDKPKYDVKAIPDDLLFAVAEKLQNAEFEKILEQKGGLTQ